MAKYTFLSKLQSTLLVVSTLISIYAVLGFSILPAVISHKIPPLAKELLKRDVTVKDIQFNPFSFEFSIDGLRVNETDNSAFVQFKQLYLNLGVVDSLLGLSLKIDQISLKSPYISVKRNSNADFNFTDLIPVEDNKQKDTSEGEIFPVTITSIALTDGKISWTDNLNSAGHQEDIYPLNLAIDNFSTIVKKQSDLGFSLKFASGGYFDWQGNLTLNPFHSKGHIELNNIDFPRVWELFLQNSVNFAILKGSELIKADYQFSSTKKSTQLIINNADLSLINIQIAEKGHTESLITIPDFKVSGIAFDLFKQNIEIEKISSQDAQFKAWLNTDNTLNFQSLFAVDNKTQTQKPSTAPAIETKESKPWNVLLKQLNINNYALNFTDKTLSPANTINLSSITLSSSKLSLQPGANLPFNLAFNFNKSGRIGIKGQTVIQPLSSKVKLNIANVALKEFQPYVNKFARLDIISGLFNLDANISLLQKKDQPFAINFKGNSHIDKLATRDQISNKDFVKWKKLSLNKIEVDLAANRYIIDSVKIDKPYARVLIRKDKSINISDIVIKQAKDKAVIAEKKPPNKDQPSVTYKVNNFAMTNGISDFSDKSLILPFSAHINHLNGSVKGISSAKNATIKVALKGKVADFAPVNIKGKISPSKGNSDFKVDFNSMPLPLMTPYMAEFAGRKIEKGNMTLKFQYKIRNKQLAASNSLLIDQLVLGDEVENPDAVSLPLGLAIALLQDGDGKISLDVPITGDLDNPEFSVASIVVDALVNVLTKIISSPFNAIASLIGNSDDISKITFSAGKATLDSQQIEKLDNLSVALSKRPALKLEIQGAAYSTNDWPQMQIAALDKQILQLRIDELIKEKSKKALPKQLAHSDEHYQRLLADLFIHKFPKLADKSLFGTPRLIDSKSGDFYTVAQAKLAALIEPDNHQLQRLAATRAKTIASHLIEKQIDISRVFLMDVKIAKEEEDQSITSQLSLTVD